MSIKHIFVQKLKKSNACRFLLSNYMKIAVQKKHLVGQILYRSLVPCKKTASILFLPELGHPTVTEVPLSHVKSRLAKHTCRSAFLADRVL